MRSSSLVGFGTLLVSFCAGVAAACSNYTPPDVPDYGPPNGIDGKHPLAPDETDAGSGITTPTGGEDAGGAGSGGDSSTGTGGGFTPDCVSQQQGTLAASGTCSVSFATDIFPNLGATGAWQCAASGCHGTKGGVAPYISGATASAMYDTIQAITAGTNPLIDPCTTDPTKSTLVCSTAGTCGGAMPLTSGGATALTSTQAQQVATWVGCGAPNN
jgi:hypothetical protein